MATTTPNFGWAVPTSTDLVKDGAVAIETLGDSIDASLVDLKGGTTGQVLSKASNTDMDFSWATAGGAGSYTLISTTAITATASITLSSIPSTYTNLVLLIDGANENSGGATTIQVNGISSAYSWIFQQASNSTTSQSTSSGSWQVIASMRYVAGGGEGGFVATFPNYTSAEDSKQFSAYGSGGNGATYSFGAVNACNAINQIKINWAGTPSAQGNVYLYGVK